MSTTAREESNNGKSTANIKSREKATISNGSSDNQKVNQNKLHGNATGSKNGDKKPKKKQSFDADAEVPEDETPAHLFKDFNTYYISKRLMGTEFKAFRADLKEKGVIEASQARFQKLQQKLMQTPLLLAKDKIAFLVGIAMLVATEYVMIALPEWMPYCYTAVLIPLLLHRFLTYHKSNWHYFMLDFCYYMQIWTIMFYFFYPTDVALFKVFFGLANGPLLMAIIMWSNRLVFHDLDKITSLYIHIGPPMVAHCTRWNPSDRLWENTNPDNYSITFTDLSYMVIFYVFWQFLYFLKTEYIDYEKFASDSTLMTSARWLSQAKPHPFYGWMLKNNIPLSGTQALCLVQLLYTCVTLVPVYALWKFRWLNTCFLLFTFGFATWLGAQYYFEVFAENYLQSLEHKIEKFHSKTPSHPQNTKYTPNSLRSVIIFVCYFGFGISALLGLLKVTVWRLPVK